MQTIISRIIFLILFFGSLGTDGRTDGWTDGRTDGRHRFQIAFHFLGRVRDGRRRWTNRPGKTPTRRWKKLGRRLWRWGQLLHPFKLCSVKQIEQLGCYSWVVPTICHTDENKKLSRLHLTFFLLLSYMTPRWTVNLQFFTTTGLRRGIRTRVLRPNFQTTETIRTNLKVARLRGTAACLTTPGEKKQCTRWIQGLGSRGASFVELRTIPSWDIAPPVGK